MLTLLIKRRNLNCKKGSEHDYVTFCAFPIINNKILKNDWTKSYLLRTLKNMVSVDVFVTAIKLLYIVKRSRTRIETALYVDFYIG